MKINSDKCIECGICTTTDYVKYSDMGVKIIKEDLTEEQKKELKDICPTGAFEN